MRIGWERRRGVDVPYGRDSQERNPGLEIEPTDGTPPLVPVHLAATPHNSRRDALPAVTAVVVRIIAESATALARHKAGGQR